MKYVILHDQDGGEEIAINPYRVSCVTHMKEGAGIYFEVESDKSFVSVKESFAETVAALEKSTVGGCS